MKYKMCNCCKKTIEATKFLPGGFVCEDCREKGKADVAK